MSAYPRGPFAVLKRVADAAYSAALYWSHEVRKPSRRAREYLFMVDTILVPTSAPVKTRRRLWRHRVHPYAKEWTR